MSEKFIPKLDKLDEYDAKRIEGATWRIPNWFSDLDALTLEKLRKFHFELLHFNGRINLISAKTEKDSDQVHFADCILGSQMILQNTEKKTIFDIGSGNGLPGIIMGILAPEREIILVERDARKTEFMRHCIGRLELKNIEAQQIQLEDLPELSIDCAVSRGFANISKAISNSRTRSKSGCDYFHFKGDNWVTEVAGIPSQLCAFWEPTLVGEYTLPERDSKLTIILTKRTAQ